MNRGFNVDEELQRLRDEDEQELLSKERQSRARREERKAKERRREDADDYNAQKSRPERSR